jgi:antitoxin YefM
MQRIQLDEDIKPLSEFRANAAALVQNLRQTKRPLVLTQRGRSTAVVLDVTEYERLLDEIELARDVTTAEAQLAKGMGLEHDEARDRVLSRFAS